MKTRQNDICAHLAALSVHLVYRLDRVQMVYARVEPNLVHDDDPRLLYLVLERADARGDVARRDDVSLALDRGLDDINVICVRHERDDEVALRNGLLERGLLLGVLGASVERSGSRVRETLDERLSRLERAAGYSVSVRALPA